MYLPEPSGKTFALTPAGNHVAVCYRFIDLGTQAVEWMGQKKLQHKVMISWELPNELMTEGEHAGQPFTMHQRYTWSMSDKSNLRHVLESWRGRAFTEEDFTGPKRFNVKNIVGKPCMLSIVHETKNGNTYANIMGVASMPKGMEAPTLINPPVYFALEKDGYDAAVFESLSDKLKETIKASPEYRELVEGVPAKPHAPEPGLDDEIPF